ncbi:hypothetical protein CA13_29640 [Planctomycetes bacterium CA13]|uniref:Uncharacterized protein n=1 Tax=Novipirellula herctigrandis TaxID=2527986 RepID=A0A5C5Z3U9_9BACT|nr:hypothetical protein CA13_29640 [Planctomycetes bacterium CA13]
MSDMPTRKDAEGLRQQNERCVAGAIDGGGGTVISITNRTPKQSIRAATHGCLVSLQSSDRKKILAGQI